MRLEVAEMRIPKDIKTRCELKIGSTVKDITANGKMIYIEFVIAYVIYY
jgi:antitoxin component of MazEF toxin-antitoxin module